MPEAETFRLFMRIVKPRPGERLGVVLVALEIGQPAVDGCRHRVELGDRLGEPQRARRRVPGVRRASARTNARARPTASLARPSHSDVHSTCDTGSMVWLAMSANGTGRICSAEPTASMVNPRLRVPRMPSVSHSPVRVSRTSALRTRTST